MSERSDANADRNTDVHSVAYDGSNAHANQYGDCNAHGDGWRFHSYTDANANRHANACTCASDLGDHRQPQRGLERRW